MKMKVKHFYILYLLLLLPAILSAQTSKPISSKPKNGEGLHSFMIRNHLSPKEDMEEFLQLNKGKFGSKNSLLLHESYLIPVKQTNLFESLFGKERETFPIESDEMKGSVFYLVSGHGGPDPGAIGKYGSHELHEDEYAYDITLRLAKKLKENGAKVHIIIQDPDDGIRDEQILKYDNHETCMGETIPLNQIDRLKQRTNKVNECFKKDTEKYRRALVLHLDSRSKRKQIDVFFYHYKKSKNGKILATTLRDIFNEKYGEHQPSRGFEGTVSDRNLYILRNTTPVSVFVELGNIQNYRDQQRFVIADNRQALANWLYLGLKKDFDNNK
ncbi:N-acetylmuramoyl-L-alanine amidase family protein [Carboxylicivirga linearis]|uniref:N-acetylmuramoyl-L-alanine amidase n=1 Tax=Carboxylicivirga linearis TaxID=1628157 RepID=A0ABS5JX53_9BACT|nr:N-acetylmuramoyl-L-alanine amidase [Carboxylicivirga linearis]MBS2099054.1 N-acetylmuramoyl-L-alanine amidase [Carboxylicivirga linearis]